MPKVVKRPDRDSWYAWITVDGRKKRLALRATTKREAEREADRREHESTDQTRVFPTLETAAQSYLDIVASQKSPATKEFYEKKLGVVLRVLGSDTRLDAIGAKQVDGMTATRMGEGCAKSTIGKELTALRGVLKLARRHGDYPYTLDEVMPEWSGTSVPRTRWVTADEAWLIIRALPEHRGAVVAFHLATGSNLGECMRAQPEDVGKNQVFLRGTKRETRRRTAPIMPWGEPFLLYAVPHIPFQAWSGMAWDLKRVTTRLGVPGLSSNDLRRTYGQWLRQAGVEPALIGITMGHADSRMVERVYGRLPVDRLRPLIDRQLCATAPSSTVDVACSSDDRPPPARRT